MLVCAACGRLAQAAVCRSCLDDLREGPIGAIPGAIPVFAGLRHVGAARRLVHNLKYGGLTSATAVLAKAMALKLPEIPTAVLVPVPRAVVRRLHHGIDAAVELAGAVGALRGLPVLSALRPALWWPRHATRAGKDRAPPRFRRRHVVPQPVILVDDVFRTGSTLFAAQRAMGHSVIGALVATAPGTIEAVVATSGEADHR